MLALLAGRALLAGYALDALLTGLTLLALLTDDALGPGIALFSLVAFRALRTGRPSLALGTLLHDDVENDRLTDDVDDDVGGDLAPKLQVGHQSLLSSRP